MHALHEACMPVPHGLLSQKPRMLGGRREQLKRSNAMRARGRRALEELRGEFEALTRDLAGGGDAAALLTLASPGARACTLPTPLCTAACLLGRL
jgi:hypothetical protein